jgi:hypothetical protein
MGTFQMTASSGSSSSPSSSHSASLSFTVFRLASCHDCLRELIEGEGRTSFRELLRESVRGEEGNFELLAGDGDRDERCGAARLMLVSVGADGDVRALLDGFPGAASCVCLPWIAFLTCPCKFGYRCLDVLVRSRTEWCAGCGWDRLRPLEEKDREDSYTTRLEGLNGIGNDVGPAEASSRLMSSKCERLPRSPGPMKSECVDEWKLLDLDDFELVRSGGLPGAPYELSSCAYVRAAMSGRGGRRREESCEDGEADGDAMRCRSWRAQTSRFGKEFNEWT